MIKDKILTQSCLLVSVSIFVVKSRTTNDFLGAIFMRRDRADLIESQKLLTQEKFATDINGLWLSNLFQKSLVAAIWYGTH